MAGITQYDVDQAEREGWRKTMRELALGASSGIDAWNKAEKTKRQQSLEDANTTLGLWDKGFSGSANDLRSAAESGDQEKINQFYSNRTDEWKTKQANELSANERKKAFEESQTALNNAKAYEARNKKFTRAGQNIAMNPDGTPMNWEQKKKREAEISSEAKIAEEERKKADPYNRLASLGAEGKSKVGAIASGLQAIDQMGKAFNAGQTMDWVDANTPLLGNLLSDTDVTAAERTMGEVVGRLQSGGAIGVLESKTFKEMGPRRGDSKEEKIKKLAQQRDFLNNKLAGFQLKPDELPGLGFATVYEHKVGAGDGLGSAAHAGGNSGAAANMKKQLQGMSREEKLRILQGK